VRRDDGRETAVKGNDDGEWSSDDVVLWLGRKQNGDVIEWWGEWSRLRWSFYSSGGWESGGLGRVACGGGVDSMLQFWLERGATEQSVARRWSRCSELVLAQCEGSVTRCGCVTMLTRGEAAPRGKRDETSLVGLKRILLGWEMKKIHAVDSAGTNGR
jgi:hypothetical protein